MPPTRYQNKRSNLHFKLKYDEDMLSMVLFLKASNLYKGTEAIRNTNMKLISTSFFDYTLEFKEEKKKKI